MRRVGRPVAYWGLCCWLAIAGAGAAAMLGGCARVGEEPVYSVHGQVLFDGQPLAEAFVVFHPIGGTQRSLSAATNAVGEFTLTTHQPDDGAPAGEYEVTVEYRELVQEGDETIRSGPNLLPSRYSQPATSGLRCTVQPQPNRLDPWRLESR